MNWKSNTSLKIVALLLAITTWFFVKNITSERRVIEGVPVEVKTHAGLRVVELSDHTVDVIIRGTPTDIGQVSRPELLAIVNLRHVETTGDVQVTLEPRVIRHPPRVQIVQVKPPEITVRLGPVASVDTGRAPSVQQTP